MSIATRRLAVVIGLMLGSGAFAPATAEAQATDLFRGIRVGMPFSEASKKLRAIADASKGSLQYFPLVIVRPGPREVTIGATLIMKGQGPEYRVDRLGIEAPPGPGDTLVVGMYRSVVYQEGKDRLQSTILSAMTETIGGAPDPQRAANTPRWYLSPAGKVITRAGPCFKLGGPDVSARIGQMSYGGLGEERATLKQQCGYYADAFMAGMQEGMVHAYDIVLVNDVLADERFQLTREMLQAEVDGAQSRDRNAAAERKP